MEQASLRTSITPSSITTASNIAKHTFATNNSQLRMVVVIVAEQSIKLDHSKHQQVAIADAVVEQKFT